MGQQCVPLYFNTMLALVFKEQQLNIEYSTRWRIAKYTWLAVRIKEMCDENAVE
jgi:hypothetical protein